MEACISGGHYKCEKLFGRYRGSACSKEIDYPLHSLSVPEFCGANHTAPSIFAPSTPSKLKPCVLVKAAQDPANTDPENKDAKIPAFRWVLGYEEVGTSTEKKSTSPCDEKSYGYSKSPKVDGVPVLTRLIVQAPSSPAHKSTNDNSCWLEESPYAASAQTSQIPLPDEYPQAQKLNPEDTLYLGILLAVLCALITFMDFVTAFLPEEYPLRAACDIKAIIHRLLCTCGGFIKPPKGKKTEDDEIFDKNYSEEGKFTPSACRMICIQLLFYILTPISLCLHCFIFIT